MGRTFQKVHCAMVGKFADGIAEKIPQWIKANGGQFSRGIDACVTHLIATKQAYKENGPLIKSAQELKTVKIVSYDWLEDSLLSPTKRPKKEESYLVQTLVEADKPQKAAKKVVPDKITKCQGKKYCKPRKTADPFVEPKGKKKPVRRTYHDKKGVAYRVTMFRSSKPPSTSREKYQLAVFETIAEPRSYSTYTKFSKTGTSKVEILTSAKATLDSAVARFEAFFREQTGKEWKGMGNDTTPPPKVGTDGESLPLHEGWFYVERNMSILSEFIRAAPQDNPETAVDSTE
ncbi:hypothetical protein N7541_002275 [Penicillium brevicompactum]|uniref:BRCT domain-containing protein n=1 Tax=Penicillium brevicompactum TaxID=5074 RepID=A0A9W9RJY9_PENBR|nr:hypothetical protein N7541_002275 [Penicillium brevicompactum]